MEHNWFLFILVFTVLYFLKQENLENLTGADLRRWKTNGFWHTHTVICFWSKPVSFHTKEHLLKQKSDPNLTVLRNQADSRLEAVVPLAAVW